MREKEKEKEKENINVSTIGDVKNQSRPKDERSTLHKVLIDNNERSMTTEEQKPYLSESVLEQRSRNGQVESLVDLNGSV